MSSNPSRTSVQNTCNNCGSFITPRFARVFGDNNDQVNGCLNCQRARDFREGNHLDEEQKRQN